MLSSKPPRRWTPRTATAPTWAVGRRGWRRACRMGNGRRFADASARCAAARSLAHHVAFAVSLRPRPTSRSDAPSARAAARWSRTPAPRIRRLPPDPSTLPRSLPSARAKVAAASRSTTAPTTRTPAGHPRASAPGSSRRWSCGLSASVSRASSAEVAASGGATSTPTTASGRATYPRRRDIAVRADHAPTRRVPRSRRGTKASPRRPVTRAITSASTRCACAAIHRAHRGLRRAAPHPYTPHPDTPKATPANPPRVRKPAAPWEPPGRVKIRLAGQGIAASTIAEWLPIYRVETTDEEVSGRAREGHFARWCEMRQKAEKAGGLV